MSANEPQACTLIEAGRRDLLALQLLIESKRAPHETIGFHAQQACEKFLKAVLVLHDIVFERTHDLIVLFGLLEQRAIQVPADKEKLRALNSYAVRFATRGVRSKWCRPQSAKHSPLVLKNGLTKRGEDYEAPHPPPPIRLQSRPAAADYPA